MKKYLLIFVLALLVFACAKKYVPEKPQGRIAPLKVALVSYQDVSKLGPREVVALYFQSLKNESYDVMYSLVSDGFKQVEPSAKTSDEFRQHMQLLYRAATIDLIDASVSSQSQNEANVNYKIEIEKDGTRKLFTSSYILRKKANGWKFINPYGDNVDNT